MQVHATVQLSQLIPGYPCLGKQITQEIGDMSSLGYAAEQVLLRAPFSSHLKSLGRTHIKAVKTLPHSLLQVAVSERAICIS